MLNTTIVNGVAMVTVEEHEEVMKRFRKGEDQLRVALSRALSEGITPAVRKVGEEALKAARKRSGMVPGERPEPRT